MAFYHLEAKIVTRGTGRTACGAAAYMSCSRIYNEYDGVQAEGWEKQYQYYVTPKKKKYMTHSEADVRGLKRASKYPKSTKFGRQNPISERRNSEEQLVTWRAAWADVVNRALERSGIEARVDHRSHAERGIDEKPTVHEGVNARIMEKMGFVSDRCELNRQIRADNALMRQLKDSIKKLTDALVTTLADMARAMEQLRQSMIVLRYHLLHLRKRRGKAVEYLSKAEPMYRDYGELARQIKEKSAERRSLKKELAALSPLSVFKRSELKKQIAQLSEEIEELTFSKNEIVTGFGKEDDKEMPAVPKQITAVKANVAKMDELEVRYTGDIEKSGREFNRLKEKAKQYDLYDLTDARLALRPQMEDEAQERIKKDIPGEKLSFWDFQISASITDEQNREDGMETWYKEQTMRRRLEQEYQQRREQPQRRRMEHDLDR